MSYKRIFASASCFLLSLSSLFVLASPARAVQEPASAEIQLWVTAGDKRLAEIKAANLSWQSQKKTKQNLSKTAEADLDFQILPEKKKQEILGFGAAFTDAACYNFNELSKEQRSSLFDELFSAQKMNLSVGRICIGSSDYAVYPYSFDDGDADPELKRFSIAHDEKYILPMLKEARKVNPGIFLLASPWSPPGWMKPNNSMLGGSMQRKTLAPYAQYFLRFLRDYARQGVDVQAVSVQNEVDTDQDGRMPACAWPQEYEIEFVRGELGPLLSKENLKTKIWIIDHNYNLWGRAICELEADNMRKYVDGVAWHGYAGSPALMSKVHDAFPEINCYWTEGGPDYTDPNYLKDWVKWSDCFNGILNNWAKCIIGWNLALDESGKPNIGPFPCGGLVTINSKSKEITRSGQYHAFAHYSKFIKRGARILQCQERKPAAPSSSAAAAEGSKNAVSLLAAENPDGSKVIVATNGGAMRELKIGFGDKTLSLKLASDSVNTLYWR